MRLYPFACYECGDVVNRPDEWCYLYNQCNRCVCARAIVEAFRRLHG